MVFLNQKLALTVPELRPGSVVYVYGGGSELLPLNPATEN